MSKMKIQDLNSDNSVMVTLKPTEAASVCGGTGSYMLNSTGAVSIGGQFYIPNSTGTISVEGRPYRADSTGTFR
jgi:hypothetical protein